VVADPQTYGGWHYMIIGGHVYSNSSKTGRWSGWSPVIFPQGISCSATAIAVDPISDSDVYVTCDEGVLKGSGGTWTSVSNYTNNRAIAIDPKNPLTIYVATEYSGPLQIAKTVDAFATAPSIVGTVGAGASSVQPVLVVDPIHPATLFASSDGLFRSDDGGNHWSQAVSGLATGCAIRGIAVDATTAGVVYLATSCGLYKTTSGGM
jgi:hypothetical protein